MSSKKKNTRARRVAPHVARYIKKWGRAPDAADKRFYDRMGRWPSQAELAFWDINRRFPKPGELAKITKAKNAEKKQARKVAARRAAETRKLKSKEVRAWERDRRALQAAQKEEVERAEQAGIKRPLRAHRWYDFYYISLTNMSVDEIHGLLLAMKRRGVKAFRIEREVPVGEYKNSNDFRSPSGFISTKFQFLARLSESDLRHGNAKTGLPSLAAMRSPGIDYMRYIIVDDISIRDHFPSDLAKTLLRKKRQTRETIKDADEAAWYLAKGKRPSAQQKAMIAQRKLIDADLPDEDEDEDED